MAILDLDASLKIIRAALGKSRELNTAPLTVAVLDGGGKLIALQRQDGAGMLRPEIAVAKAWGAVALGKSTRLLARDAEERPAFMSALTTLVAGNLVPVPGGVLVRGDGGAVLGAVGISGDTSDLDELCALAGIQAAGFEAEVEPAEMAGSVSAVAGSGQAVN